MQQSLAAFVTAEWTLIGFSVFRPAENVSEWCSARWMFKFPDLNSHRPGCLHRVSCFSSQVSNWTEHKCEKKPKEILKSQAFCFFFAGGVPGNGRTLQKKEKKLNPPSAVCPFFFDFMFFFFSGQAQRDLKQTGL